MRFDAITRKSGFMAILLAIVIVVATLVRSSVAPLGIEVAEFPFMERWFSKLLAGAIFVATSILVGRLFVQLGLSKSYSTLPIPIYCMLACGIALSPHTLNVAVIAFLFTYAIYLISKSSASNDEMNTLFLGSLLLGTLPLLAPSTIPLGAIMLVAIPFFTLSVRQVLVMYVGWLLPLFSASYIMWYAGDSFFALAENMAEDMVREHTFPNAEIPYGAIAIGAVVVVTLIWGAIYPTYKRSNPFALIRIRKTVSFFIIMSVIALSMLLLPGCGLEILPIVALPITILMSFVLNITPTRESTIAYWILLAVTLTHLFVA